MPAKVKGGYFTKAEIVSGIMEMLPMYYDLWGDPVYGPLTGVAARFRGGIGMHMLCPVCDQYIYSPCRSWQFNAKSVMAPAKRHLLRHTKDELMPYYMAVMV